MNEGGSYESSLLLTLEEISQLVAHSHDPGETLSNIVRLIQGRFHTAVCSVYCYVPERGELVLGATVGLKPEAIGQVLKEPAGSKNTLAVLKAVEVGLKGAKFTTTGTETRVTVKVPAAPRSTSDGKPLTPRALVAPALTATLVVAINFAWAVSLTVIVCVPAAFRVTLKVCAPASAALQV